MTLSELKDRADDARRLLIAAYLRGSFAIPDEIIDALLGDEEQFLQQFTELENANNLARQAGTQLGKILVAINEAFVAVKIYSIARDDSLNAAMKWKLENV